ncbi:restriction endonuclease subunit S [Streptomyces sp. NPDC057298]|uniref:restriction endonuclease subunit S n=1 Tax=Streptomyces sp. NPDC057298 TaxID=3346091 RepID=UPI003639F8A1
MRGEVALRGRGLSAAGWRYVPLKDVGTWLSGGTPSTSNDAYWGGDIPWISGASMKSFRITDSDRKLTDIGARNGSRLVSKGTTLFVVRGMSLKSEFRVGVTERTVAFGQDCKAIIPAKGIDPEFLARAVQSRTSEILTLVEETSHGTGRLDTARLQELEIPVPSLDEQHRIVAAHAAFERRIGALERTLVKLRKAETAVVASALDAQHCVPLDTWLSRIEAGKSPLAEDTSARDGEWGVLKVSAVQAGWFEPAENKVLRDPEHIDPRYEVRPGDLLMTRANTEELVGLACVVREPGPRLLLSDKTLRLVPDEGSAETEFIALTLASPAVRAQIKAAATGTSASMKNIGQEAIRALLVPDVSLVVQRQAVAGVSGIQRRVRVYRRQIIKLRTIQQGVVEDLLAGRVCLAAA